MFIQTRKARSLNPCRLIDWLIRIDWLPAPFTWLNVIQSRLTSMGTQTDWWRTLNEWLWLIQLRTSTAFRPNRLYFIKTDWLRRTKIDVIYWLIDSCDSIDKQIKYQFKLWIPELWYMFDWLDSTLDPLRQIDWLIDWLIVLTPTTTTTRFHRFHWLIDWEVMIGLCPWLTDWPRLILSSVLDLPGIAVPPGATITSRSAVRIRINWSDWWLVGLHDLLWDWLIANALEWLKVSDLIDWLVIPGIAVPPGVTHSVSHHPLIHGFRNDFI